MISLEQRLQKPEAEGFIRGLYGNMYGGNPNGSPVQLRKLLSGLIEYSTAAVWLLLLSPLQSHPRIRSYTESYILSVQKSVSTYFQELSTAFPGHQKKMALTAEETASKINDMTAFYPNDAARLSALQQHIESRLEETVASAEQIMVKNDRTARRFYLGFYSSAALTLGGFAYLVLEKSLGVDLPQGIGLFDLEKISLLSLLGGAGGTLASVLWPLGKQSSLDREREGLIERSTTEALQAFTSTS